MTDHHQQHFAGDTEWSPLQRHLNMLVSELPIQDLRHTVKLQDLFLLCNERVNSWIMYLKIKRRLAYDGLTPYQTINPVILSQMRQWFDEHIELNDVDWTSPLLGCIVRYAIFTKDQSWLRLLIEYGADITELDQGCLFDIAFSPSNISYHDRYQMITIVHYLVKVLDINVDYFHYQSFLHTDPARSNNNVRIESVELFNFLLNHCGQLTDFCTHMYQELTDIRYPHLLTLPLYTNPKVRNFITLILSTDLLAKPNNTLYSILIHDCRPINRTEKRAWANPMKYISDSAGHKTILILMIGVIKTYEFIRNSFFENWCDELLVLWLDYCAAIDKGSAWLLLELYEDQRRLPIVEALGKLCGKNGLIKALEKLLSMTKHSYQNYSDEDTRVLSFRRYQNLLHSVLSSTQRVTILQYLIESEELDINQHHTQALHSVTYSLCSWLFVSISDNVKSLQPTETIKCIEYLANFTTFSLIGSLDHQPNELVLQAALTNNCTNLVDALLKWCYGYNLEIISPLYESTQCININECHILFQNKMLNPIMYVIASSNSTAAGYSEKCIAYFMDHHKADIDACDKDGNTPLMMAVKNEKWNIAKHLLSDYEPNIRRMNNLGESVEILLDDRSHPDVLTIVQALQQVR